MKNCTLEIKSYQRINNTHYEKHTVLQVFCNTYIFYNLFILLLGKCVYPYEYMDDLETFNETSLIEKEDFYSHLNMEDITGTDHAKRVYKDFEIKYLG